MTLPADINDFIDPILRTFERNLRANVQGHLVTGYLQGSAQMLEWGRTATTDMPIYYEGPPMQQAMTYAQKHSATLVKGMNDETREQMRGVIGKAIEQKRGIPGLSRDLRNQINGMGKVRAKMIARTETCDALESAFMDRAKDMKVTGKEWVWVGDSGDWDCRCEDNANAGAIPIDKPFPSGDMRPPAHPNCRCALAPVMLRDTTPAKLLRVEPVRARPTKGIPKGTQDFIANKLKVTGKKQGDINGLRSTTKAIEQAKLPDSHLATVRDIQLNAAKVQARTPGSMAYCDGSNNIVLAGKVGHENVVHEIGHAFWNKRVFVPEKISKIKWDILDVFKASTKTGKGFVSSYARTNVDEFFAECYAAYSKNPAAFTKLNPSMGKILKVLWTW